MMTPDAVVEAYVSDVARRLPRAKRNDVALELQALLRDELQGKAEMSGRAADEAMALELVRAFGAPEEVAERYRPAGFTIIPATRSARFAAVALGGVVLQWLGTLPTALLKEPGRELVMLGAWWLTYGLGALWWPGFMVTAAIAGGWVRHRWPPAPVSTWRPSSRDRDEINRTTWVISSIAAAFGIAALVGAPWWAKNFLPPAAAGVFEYDADFLPLGGAVVVAMWTLTAVSCAIVFFEGRWRALTRQIDLAATLLWFAVLTWLVVGPRIFVNDAADEAAKFWMGVVAAMVAIDLAVKIYRQMQRPRAVALAGIVKT
ncbi:MAG: hypothetical protein HOP13_14320 [Alphaproteobacteria bacterium]|nr:hypothetical protein [Alphaproteobacteria bacterium]